MKVKKKVKVGLLGLGVVGAELASLINQNSKKIATETGCEIIIEKVFVRNTSKTRDIDTTTLQLTTDVNEILNNDEIDIICECIGGNGFDKTSEYILKAIGNKKHVVMSSKKALANYAEEILHSAQLNQVQLKYDACVGGGIPIAKILEHSFNNQKLLKIMGIFNATSNFIYSNMLENNDSFSNALLKAQEKGYAENDPSDDIDAIDSLNKLIILAIFGFKAIIKPSDLNPVTFSKIEIKDMQQAKALGYTIKPLAFIKHEIEGLKYVIGPCLISSGHIVANTLSNNNVIIIEGEYCGELGFYGQGAGAKPTASAMFDDLINILKTEKVLQINTAKYEKSQNISKYETAYYWRFSVKNEVGVLTNLSSIFAQSNVNIERIIQKDENDEGIEIVVLTSVVPDKVLQILKTNFKNNQIHAKALIPII
jgi:homoserine dehydrogenase